MGKYAHTFVGQALFLAVREFLPQGAVSDSVKVRDLSGHVVVGRQLITGVAIEITPHRCQGLLGLLELKLLSLEFFIQFAIVDR